MLLWLWSKQNPRGLPLDHIDHNRQSWNSPSCLFCAFVHGVLLQPWQQDREMLRTVGTDSLLAWSAATDGVVALSDHLRRVLCYTSSFPSGISCGREAGTPVSANFLPCCLRVLISLLALTLKAFWPSLISLQGDFQGEEARLAC